MTSNIAKKDPVDNNEIDTFNQPNYNIAKTSGEEIDLSDPEQLEKIARVSEYLAKKYHGLIVTDGRDGRKAANDAYHEINKFWKLIDETRKKEKREALADYEDMKKNLDQALAPLLQIKDELKKARRESREESRQIEKGKRHDENRHIASEMAKARDIIPGLAVDLVDKHYMEITESKKSKLEREKIIARILDESIKYGARIGSKTFNVKTGAIEKQAVTLEFEGEPRLIESLLKIIYSIESLEVTARTEATQQLVQKTLGRTLK